MSDRASRWDAPAASSSSAAPGSAADTKPSDAATAAAAIAAKIAASLRGAAGSNALVMRDKEEGDFVRDIEINDLRNRYVLTKGPTQKQVSVFVLATVAEKGRSVWGILVASKGLWLGMVSIRLAEGGRLECK